METKEPQAWTPRLSEHRLKTRVPPLCLTSAQIRIYQKAFEDAVQNGLPKRVIVLGAMPELRDLAIENGFECYTVDISKDALEKFTAVMKHKGNDKNIMVLKNWLDMEYDDCFFSIIIGDISLENLCTLKEFEFMLGKISRMLCSHGFLCYRAVLLTEDFKPFGSVKEIINAYRKKQIDLLDVFCELRIWLYLNQVYDESTKIFDVKKSRELLLMDFKNGTLTEEEYKALRGYWHDTDRNIILSKKEFIELLKKNHLVFKEEFIDTQFRAGKYIVPMIFQKRENK